MAKSASAKSNRKKTVKVEPQKKVKGKYKSAPPLEKPDEGFAIDTKLELPSEIKSHKKSYNTTNYSFSHLSLKDLIEARDLFHMHLINKRNVVATAVGRYLIRRDEVDKNGRYVRREKRSVRTLENSVVLDISWPCVIVFVSKYEEEKDLISDGGNNIVPKTIYMPDGKVVPVCIVVAVKNQIADTHVDMSSLRYPYNYIGGGSPLIINSQGVQRVASVGCVVTNGNKYYALTNKHVAGEEGEIVNTKWGNSEPSRIGISSGNSLGKAKFSELYDGWNSKNMLVNCDAGLIEIDDLNRWKTEILGIGRMDEMYDLNTLNFTLSLISEYEVSGDKLVARNGKVKGYGAISGIINGEIAALFYRYKAVAGDEYVSDLLIRGRYGNQLNLHHGDSGTILLLENKTEEGEIKYQPLALHWGQHEFIDAKSKSKFTYSLATCLSNICRKLDVELVRGWNINSDFSWGKVGHYTVGNAAIDAIKDPRLKSLFKNNIENISFRDNDINIDLTEKNNPNLGNDPTTGFCPLADVPDIIWKQYKVSRDGTTGHPWGRKGDENPNHYADVDAPTTDGKTLFELCDSLPKMTVQVWMDYYNNIDKAAIGLAADKQISQGLVCFRVWQIYDYMVQAAKDNDVERFVFAGGVLAHYIGDACQPLHSSYMSDGDPMDNETIMYTPPRGGSRHPKGIPYEKVVNLGSGVHVAYEDHMIDQYIDDILVDLKNLMSDGNAPVNREQISPINSGQGAAYAILKLMELTQNTITPKEIVEAYKVAKGNSDVATELYQEFGDRTVICMARGCRYLAAVWDAAWSINGNRINSTAKVKETDLANLYADPDELKSYHLDTIENVLK